MKAIHSIANILILLGALALISGVCYKLFNLWWFYLTGSAFLKFANTCLLLGIALYVRELIPSKQE